MADDKPSGCLVAIFRVFAIKPSPVASAPALPYRCKEYLLSKAERSFFGALCQAVGKEYWIFPKIRVADLLYMPKGTESRQKYFNKIQAKHIDFVLCDRESVRPLLAIELDDSSHQRADRQSRDAFVDEALRVACLPLLRIPVKTGYGVGDLKSTIRARIGSAIR